MAKLKKKKKKKKRMGSRILRVRKNKGGGQR